MDAGETPKLRSQTDGAAKAGEARSPGMDRAVQVTAFTEHGGNAADLV